MMEVLHIPRRSVGWIEGNSQWNGAVELWLTAEITDRDAIKFHVKTTRDSVWAYNGLWGAYADTIKIPADSDTAQVIKEPYQFQNGTVEYDFYIPTSEIGKTASVWISLVGGSAMGGVFTITAEMFIGASSLSVSPGYIGYNNPISISPLTTDAKHTLTVSCAGITKTLLDHSSDITATWRPTVEEYAPNITAAKYADATFTCTTYIGDVNVGSKSKTVTMSLREIDVAPIMILLYADATELFNRYGKYISGQSKYWVKASAEFRYGATMKSVRITANGETYTTDRVTTGPISDATITAKITDSRGFDSGTAKVSVDMYSYQKPSASIIEVYHCTQDGTKDMNGQYLAVKAAATMTSLDGQNSLVIKAQVKAANSSGSFVDAGELTNNTATVLSGTWSPDTSWLVKVTATDELENSAEVYAKAATRVYAIHVKDGVTGAAIGKAAEYDNVLELPEGWRIKIGDNYWPE